MDKEKYIAPEMEIIVFENADVITTSPETDPTWQRQAVLRGLPVRIYSLKIWQAGVYDLSMRASYQDLIFLFAYGILNTEIRRLCGGHRVILPYPMMESVAIIWISERRSRSALKTSRRWLTGTVIMSIRRWWFGTSWTAVQWWICSHALEDSANPSIWVCCGISLKLVKIIHSCFKV